MPESKFEAQLLERYLNAIQYFKNDNISSYT